MSLLPSACSNQFEALAARDVPVNVSMLLKMFKIRVVPHEPSSTPTEDMMFDDSIQMF